MNARALTAALGGRWHGSYGLAPCPTHDDGKSPALKIRDDPRKSDGIDLHCFAGCPWRDVKAVLRERGLIDDPTQGDPYQQRRRATAATHRAEPPARATAASNANSDHARDIFRAARPAGGTDAETYLRGRQITIPIPRSIRFHPNLKHGPTGLYLPAMIGAVQGPDRRIIGIHRAFLTPGGGDKAQVSSPRMMLGACAGGAVRLAAAAPELAVGEGIETCLSAMQAAGIPAWATLSTSGLKSVVLPPEVKCVIILADGDDPGEAAAAGDKVARGNAFKEAFRRLLVGRLPGA